MKKSLGVKRIEKRPVRLELIPQRSSVGGLERGQALLAVGRSWDCLLAVGRHGRVKPVR